MLQPLIVLVALISLTALTVLTALFALTVPASLMVSNCFSWGNTFVVGGGVGGGICTTVQYYYSHWSRDSVCPICGIYYVMHERGTVDFPICLAPKYHGQSLAQNYEFCLCLA